MVQNLLKNSSFNRPALWVSASVISIFLLSLVVMQVDFQETFEIAKNVSWIFIIISFFFLFSEGIATALRIWLFASKKPPVANALKANAWYVLFLVILPARLGEIAAIFVLERYLKQSYGAAAMSILIQRLYDVVILSVIFLIALLGLGDFVDKNIVGFSAFILIALSLFILANTEVFLTILASCFNKKNNGFLRRIRKLALQARIYTRHHLNRSYVSLAIFFTVLKWVSNIGALTCCFLAFNLDLGAFENITIASAYNFLAIIPLQTIGGIGIGEAGLSLLLTTMGLSISIAAGISLMIRFIVLIFPFIFWCAIMGSLRLKERLGP